MIEAGIRDKIWAKYKLTQRQDCFNEGLTSLGIENVVGILAILGFSILLTLGCLFFEFFAKQILFKSKNLWTKIHHELFSCLVFCAGNVKASQVSVKRFSQHSLSISQIVFPSVIMKMLEKPYSCIVLSCFVLATLLCVFIRGQDKSKSFQREEIQEKLSSILHYFQTNRNLINLDTYLSLAVTKSIL